MENGFHLDRYLEALKNEGKKPGTLKQYHSDLKQFVSWLDESVKEDLLHIESTHVTAYIDHLREKKLSDTTIKRHISALNQFLAFYDIGAELPAEQAETHRATTLESSDFISDQEMHRLLESMQRTIDSKARDFLMDRNLAIVHLIRYKGLRPKEIASINLGMVNLGQANLEFKQSLYKLSGKTIEHIRAYLQTIEPLKRPRLHSQEPLFVSYNNRSQDYQYHYEKDEPKRLSTRSIQEMIKDEVKLAGLRKLSAKHLRNSCILDHIRSGQDDKEMLRYFHLTHPFSLLRYKDFIKQER